MSSVPDKTKKRKTLDRPCPECEGMLELVTFSHIDGGASYEESYIRCEDCGYIERKKIPSHKNKEAFNPKW